MSAAYAKSMAPGEMFSSAREQMEAMVTHLQSREMLSAQHGQVEAWVREQGRELERRLLQAHVDLRAALERPVPVRGDDGIERTYRRPSGRPLGSMLGPIVVSRLAYQAQGVDGRHPMDGALNSTCRPSCTRTGCVASPPRSRRRDAQRSSSPATRALSRCRARTAR